MLHRMDRRRPPISALFVLCCTLGLSACIASNQRGYPLYPDGRVLEQSQVATVAGYIQTIDNKDVSAHGTRFEVLPGCHLVVTPTASGSLGNTGGSVITTGHQAFALRMKAGHSYTIETGSAPFMSGPTGGAYVRAREQAPEGNTLQEFAPIKDSQEIRNCRDDGGSPSRGPLQRDS
jgi:hypothetical protein